MKKNMAHDDFRPTILIANHDSSDPFSRRSPVCSPSPQLYSVRHSRSRIANFKVVANSGSSWHKFAHPANAVIHKLNAGSSATPGRSSTQDADWWNALLPPLLWPRHPCPCQPSQASTCPDENDKWRTYPVVARWNPWTPRDLILASPLPLSYQEKPL